MPQLIQLRQRIAAIETIQKITHAMQLVSMSTHIRLRDKKIRIEEYYHALRTIFNRALQQYPSWHNTLLYPTAPSHEKPLLIVIGSQKGLCGTFNTQLFHTFEKDLIKHQFTHATVISIGKKVTDYIKTHQKSLPIPLNLLTSFDDLSWVTGNAIVSSLLTLILNEANPYSTVIIYSNYSVSFFNQRQHITTLIPFTSPPRLENDADISDDFVWEDDPGTIVDAVAQQCLRATLHNIIIQSLLAEHSARFISMDNATRNATRLQEAMHLYYNKMRQAKITKELTELSSSFQQNLGS